MHTDLVETIVARRLRALADESDAAPYDWAEFQRRRQGAASASTGRAPSGRLAALATAAIVAAVLVGVAVFRSSHQHAPGRAPADTAARLDASPGEEQASTRAIEGWLASLPHGPVVMRAGTDAAVTSLQDQIAALDDLMSVERAAGARPDKVIALERQRSQLVSSLAQVLYAEMLASATP